MPSPDHPLQPDGKQRFGQLLNWHMLRGTRPDGDINRPGRRWTSKTLGAALGVSDRTVRYWLKDEHLPPEIESLERILFRENPRFHEWRLALRKAHNEAGTAADELSPPTKNQTLPPRLGSFIGRDQQLSELAAALDSSSLPVAIHGLGGMGKSSLAIEYAYRHHGRYAGVWWCAAETSTDLVNSLASLGMSIGLRRAEDSNLSRAAAATLDALSNSDGCWLLIYDNVPDPEEIREFLPRIGTKLIITSRFSDWQPWAYEHSLGVLPSSDAIHLLQTRSIRTDQIGATELARVLDHLPLALDHAAAYCKRSGLDFSEYARRAEALIAIAPKGVAYPRSVVATFNIAVDLVAAENPRAEQLLKVFSFLAPDGFPAEIVAHIVSDERQREDALSALSSVSLINHRVENSDSTISMHRLVQAATRGRLEMTGETSSISQAAVETLERHFPSGVFRDAKSWQRYANLVPSVLVARSHVGLLQNLHWTRLLSGTGAYLRQRARYPEAEAVLREAVSILDEMVGEQDSSISYAINMLANVLFETGRYDEAEALFRRVLDISKRMRSKNHADIGQAENNLGNLLWVKGENQEAERHLLAALEIRISTLGKKHLDTAQSMMNLAVLFRRTGRFKEAENNFRDAIEVGEAVLGPNHPELGDWLSNYGNLLYEQKRLDDAEAAFVRAIEIAEHEFGRQHPDVAMRLNNLSRVLRDTGRAAAAETLAREAIDEWTRSIGKNHAYTGRGYENLAQILMKLGRLQDALTAAEAAVQIHEASLGRTHAWLGESIATHNAIKAVLKN